MAEQKTEGKNTKALKAGVWYSASSITVKAITILTTPIFTRLINKEQIGIVSTFNSWYTLLLIFCTLNLTYSIGRAKLDFPGKFEEYVGSMQVLSFLFTLGLCLVSLPFLKPIAKAFELNEPLVLILMLFLLIHPIINFTQSKFRYSYKYKGNIAIAAYSTISNVTLSFLFLLIFTEERYYARVLGHVLPGVFLGLAFWFITLKKKNAVINLEYWKYGLGIGLPLILHSLSLNILGQSDRIMITKFCGSGFTGIYGIAYGYALLINIILGAANEAWLPWFHDSYFAEEYDQIKKNVKPLVVLGCMLGIGCIAIGPEAMAVLGPKDYQVGVWVIAPVTIGTVCQFIYQQYVHIELHLKKTQYISMGTIIAAVLNIGLNFIFIPKYGFIAAAYTTLVSYFVNMFIHFTVTRVILKVKLYDDWFMFLAIGIVIAISALFMSLYSTILLRYAILVAICILYLVFNRNTIKTAYAKLKGKKSK